MQTLRALALAMAAMFAALMLSRAAEVPPDMSGVHDFDFQIGDWRVHHRVKRPSGDDSPSNGS